MPQKVLGRDPKEEPDRLGKTILKEGGTGWK
jgi:hypothetical protein